MKKKIWFLAGMIVAVASTAQAVTYGFQNITFNNSAAVDATVSSQLSVDVTPASDNRHALFTFHNIGSMSATISEIYFDDGSLLSIAQIQNGAGVSFNTGGTRGVTPADLPGGKPAGFEATAIFSTQASGNNATGIDPNETLGILFNLQSGMTFADTESALANGSLRIGLHVRNIGTGGQSDSFVNTPPGSPPSVADTSATLTLLGMAMLGVEWLRRKFAKS